MSCSFGVETGRDRKSTKELVFEVFSRKSPHSNLSTIDYLFSYTTIQPHSIRYERRRRFAARHHPGRSYEGTSMLLFIPQTASTTLLPAVQASKQNFLKASPSTSLT